MKFATPLLLAGVVVGTVVSGGVFSAASAASQQDCSTAKPASVYTDGSEHYFGVCAGGAYVQVNELAHAGNGQPVVEAKTGQPALDALLPSLSAPVVPNDVQCRARVGDAVVIYTDGLNHVLGACDPYGNTVQLNELMGALKNRNNLVDVRTTLVNATIQTQAEDGAQGVVLHPKVVIKPAG